MRQLASLQRIRKIEQIPGYDRVVKATVLGWTCIVGKNDFKENDLCVYFEIDSKLYPHPVWDSFLKSRNYKIKTLKMCGILSQGLALPIEIIDRIAPSSAKTTMAEGTDLTNVLKVKHICESIVKPVRKSKHPIFNYAMKWATFRLIYRLLFVGKKRSGFPTHLISKTDESNIQTVPEILISTQRTRFYITEKLEGQSATYIYSQKGGWLNKLLKRNEFIVCSHNIRLGSDNSNWWIIAGRKLIRRKLSVYHEKTGKHIAVQGEICGPGIQGNIYKLRELDFYVFNVKDLDEDTYYNLKEKKVFCTETGLSIVPILEENLSFNDMTVEEILKESNGISVLADIPREGLVIRSHATDAISCKVKSPAYLLGKTHESLT